MKGLRLPRFITAKEKDFRTTRPSRHCGEAQESTQCVQCVVLVCMVCSECLQCIYSVCSLQFRTKQQAAIASAWEDEGHDELLQDFVDIFTKVPPRFRTHVKMRWDEDWLYVAGFLQETDVWANQTEHDSVSLCHSLITVCLFWCVQGKWMLSMETPLCSVVDSTQTYLKEGFAVFSVCSPLSRLLRHLVRALSRS